MACKYIYKGITYSSKEEFINKVIPTLQNSTLSKFDKVPTNKQVYNASIKNYEDNIVNFEKAIQAIKDNNYKIILPNNTGRYVASVESEGIRGGTIPIAENPYTKEAKEGKFDKEYALSYLKERIEIEKGSIENENRKIKDIEKVENDVYNKNINSNQFLQLLNKDNNWVTFFIKSIIQDSAKKGYEKVLFPTGNTASKVEGHTTLEEFKKQKEDRIKQLEIEKNKYESSNYIVHRYNEFDSSDKTFEFKSIDEANSFLSDKSLSRKESPKQYYSLPKDNRDVIEATTANITKEINQLKQELERVEGPEGFGALKPIYNFYENTVTNILNKTYGKENVKVITDEYGNTWNEITLEKKHTQRISFNITPTISLAENNLKYNTQLKEFYRGELQGPIEFGNPKRILQEVGMNNIPIRMSQDTLQGLLDKHKEIDKVDLFDLPNGINNPIMVMQGNHSQSDSDSVWIMSSIKNKDGLYIDVIIKMQNTGKSYNITSIYPRYSIYGVLKNLDSQDLLFVNKNKALNYYEGLQQKADASWSTWSPFVGSTNINQFKDIANKISKKIEGFKNTISDERVYHIQTEQSETQFNNFLKKYPSVLETKRNIEEVDKSIKLVDELNNLYPELYASIITSGQNHFVDVTEKNDLPKEYKDTIVDKNISPALEGDILVNKLLTKMQKLFPKFTYEFIDEAQAERLCPLLTKDEIKNTKGFVLGNTVYLISGKFTPEVVVEEFLHPFVNFLELDNPILLDNLFKEGLEMYGDLKGIYDAYLAKFDEITAKKEVATRALSYLVTDKEIEKSQQKRNLLNKIIDWFKSLFQRSNIKISGYPTSLTLKELAGQISDSEHTLNYVLSEAHNFSISNPDKIKTRWEQIGQIMSKNGLTKVGDKEGYRNSKGEVVKRITDIVKEKNKKFFSQGENDFTAEERAEFDLMAERGTNFHKDIENMFRRYVDASTGLKKNLDEVNTENFQIELKISDSKKEAYIESLNGLVQNILNSYSDDTRFRFETIVFNAKKKVAGTIDFMAVTTGGKIDIMDWKSIYSLKDGRIPGYKKTGFNTQLGEYVQAIQNQLLLTNEDFGKVRVIPILPTIEKGTGIVTDIKISTVKPEEEIVEALYPILTEYDEAFSKEAKTFVAGFNDIIKTENKRLSRESGYERKDYELQNELDDAVRNLLIANNSDRINAFIKTIENRTTQYLKDVADFITNNDSPTEEEERLFAEKMKEGIHSLRALKSFITFSNNRVFTDSDQELEYLKVKSRIEKLNLNLDEGVKKFIKKFGDKHGINRIDSPESKIGFFSKWTRQLSNAATKSTLLLEKLLRPVLNAISIDKQAIQYKWTNAKNNLQEWGTKNGKSLKQVYELFLDKYDNEDNPLNGQYNGMFKSTISKKFLKLKDDAQIADAKDRIAFYKKFYDLEGYQKAYEQEYIRKSGEILAKIYNATNEELNKKAQENAIKKFKKEFSPSNPETSLFQDNWLLNKFLKLDDEEVRNIYYSDFYKMLLKDSNKPLLTAWESMQDVISRAQGTGIDTQLGINKRFIPRMFKGIVETGMDAKSQKERFVRELHINPDDYNYGSINPATGKEESSMFLYYTQRLENSISYTVKDEKGIEFEKTTYDFKNLSTDLVQMFEKFDKNVSYIEHMQGLEAFTDVLSEFEATKRVIDTDRFGKNLKEQPISQGYVGENYKYFDKFRKFYIYNIKMQDVKDKVITIPFLKQNGNPVTVSGVKMVGNIANLARMTAFSIPNITSPLRNMIAGRLSTSFDGSKHLSGGSFDVRNAMHFLDHTMLEPFQKVMASEENQKFAAAITLFLPDLQLHESRNSDKLSMNAGWQILTPERLQVLMSSSEGVIPIALLRAFIKNSTVKDGKIININILAEQEIKSKYGVDSKYSLPESIKLGQIEKEIKERVNELKKDNLFNYLELTKDGKDKILSIKGVDRNDPSVHDLTNLIHNYAQRATGMISDSDISLARTNFLAKQLFMYRGWIPKTVYARFGGLSYNNLTQGYEQGRIRNLIDYLSKHTEKRLDFMKRLTLGFVGITDKDLLIKIAKEHRLVKYKQLQDSGQDIRELSEEEYVDMFLQNVKNSYKELRTLAGLFTIINLGLLAGGEGGDDKEKNLARLAQRELTKYYKELTFYYDPLSAYEIIKNPFPLLSYTGNLLLLTKNIMAEPFNPEGNKPLKYLFRSMPITKEIISYTPIFDPKLAEDLGIKINPNYAIAR